MAEKRKRIPRYSKVQVNGYEYYKTDVEDADGKRIILYGKTREEVYKRKMAALEQIDSATFRRKSYGCRVLRKVATDAVCPCACHDPDGLYIQSAEAHYWGTGRKENG